MNLNYKSVYSPNNLPNTIKDGTYIVNFDEYKSIKTRWIAFYASGNSVTYFDSFGVGYISAEIKEFIFK